MSSPSRFTCARPGRQVHLACDPSHVEVFPPALILDIAGLGRPRWRPSAPPDGAVPSRKTLQARSDRAEECVAISDRQRLGGAENGVELFVREPDRGHGQPPYARKWFAATSAAGALGQNNAR